MFTIDNLTVRFGATTVVDHVSIRCEPGAVTAIIGPNGAGKTSLFDAVTGYVAASDGEVSCAGRRIDRRPPHAVARRGLARTFQTPRLFDGMTVMENLLVAAPDGGLLELVPRAITRVGLKRTEARAREKARYWLDFLRLNDKAHLRAEELSGGQRKLVELGRALMTEPTFVLLDEPVAGVAPALVRDISARLRELAQEGLGVVVIEHNMEFVMGIAQDVYVLASGQVIAHGEPAHVRNEPAVLEAYLGGVVA